VESLLELEKALDTEKPMMNLKAAAAGTLSLLLLWGGFIALPHLVCSWVDQICLPSLAVTTLRQQSERFWLPRNLPLAMCIATDIFCTRRAFACTGSATGSRSQQTKGGA
jgi:hypothetical protein